LSTEAIAVADAVAEATVAEAGVAKATVAEAVGDIAAPKVLRGTLTLYMTRSYVVQALPKDIVMTPVNPWLHTVEGLMTATTYQVVGGDFDLRRGTGYLDMDGGTVITNIKSGQSMVLFGIRFNLANHTIDYTWKTADGDVPVNALDVAGPGQGEVRGKFGTYTAKEVFVNRESAEFMNDLLQTDAFVDEGLFGALSAQFELADAASTDGVVQWGLRN